MVKAVVVIDKVNPRSGKIAEALMLGAAKMGWNPTLVDYAHAIPQGDICLAYGWKHRVMFEAYRKEGLDYIYIDLGYWNRKSRQGDYGGYHKCSLNARNPTAYFQRNRRKDRLGGAPEIQPWRKSGDAVLLAGLSAKSAKGGDLEPQEWELRMIDKIKAVSDRPIIYRPKPSWKGAVPIRGTIFSPPEEQLVDVFSRTWIAVCLHSNVGVDAIAAGIPTHSEEGVASVFSTPLEEIETPLINFNRKQFLADVSYTQWSKDEIANGAMLGQFLGDGLLFKGAE